MQTEYVEALETHAVDLPDGQRLTVDRGELVPSDHPVVRMNPAKFAPAAMSSRFDVVEQATAAPGEKRDTPRRRAGRDPRNEKE